MVNNDPPAGEMVAQQAILPETTSEDTALRLLPTSLFCSLPLSHDVQSIIDTFPKTESVGRKKPRKLPCLYCDRTFVADTLRTKHVERCHSVKQARRSSSRFQQVSATLQCMFCNAFHAQPSADLADLFRHLADEHADRYFACIDCEERFVLSSQLHEHLEEERHQGNQANLVLDEDEEMEQMEEKDQRGKRVKSTKLGIKRSARLLNKELPQKIAQRQRKQSGRKPEEVGERDAIKAGVHEHPYPPYDLFYRVKKITDHSIDNLRITALTFNDVFDQAFYTRIRCNIADNLRNHIDGKLFKNEESESRISNFEKQQAELCQTTEHGHFGCEISLNAATPVAALLTSHVGDDPETQIEYAAKASKKKSKPDEVHYKYFTRRKYQASIREIKENRDLSKLDMWTQFAVKTRQQAIVNGTKSEKERQEYKKSDEYKVQQRNDELNKILDRRGPFEDLKEEASQQAQRDGNVSRESRAVASGLLEQVLGNVFEAAMKEHSKTELTDTKIPEYLNLRKASLTDDSLIDRSDKITLICASEETDNFEVPHVPPRDKHTLVELTGEWTRARLYICAACGIKVGNMRELMDHKGIDHQNVWSQHYEFVGKQGEYYRNLNIPGLGKVETIETSPLYKSWVRSNARTCSKCKKQCHALGELHRHILECGEDWSWMIMRKKCRYRPFGTRRKRRGLFKRQTSHVKEKSNDGENGKEEKKKIAKPIGPRVKPSDAETIQRMLANLPPKRATRKIMSLKDGFPRQVRKVDAKKSNAKTKELSASDKKRKLLVNNKCNPVGNIRKSVRNISKVISSALIDNNVRIRRKMKFNQPRVVVREQSKIEPPVSLGDLTEEERAVEVKKKITLLKKVQSLRKSVIKKRTDIKSDKDDETGVRRTRSTTTILPPDLELEQPEKLYKKLGSKLMRGLNLRKKNDAADNKPEVTCENCDSVKSKPRFGGIKRAVKKLRGTKRKLGGEEQNTMEENIEDQKEIKADVSCDHFLEENSQEKDTPSISEPETHPIFETTAPSQSILDPFLMKSTETDTLPTPTTPIVTTKRKLCKRTKGLNDCIAMLTSKLICKTNCMTQNTNEPTKPDTILPLEVHDITPNDTTTEEQNVVIPEDPISEEVLESAKEPASPSDFSRDLTTTTSLISPLNLPAVEQDKENIELEHKSIPKFDKVMDHVIKELRNGHHLDGNKVLTVQADEQLFNGAAKNGGKLTARCKLLQNSVETTEFLIQDQFNRTWMEEETFANGSFDRKWESRRTLPQRKSRRDVNLYESPIQEYNWEINDVHDVHNTAKTGFEEKPEEGNKLDGNLADSKRFDVEQRRESDKVYDVGVVPVQNNMIEDKLTETTTETSWDNSTDDVGAQKLLEISVARVEDDSTQETMKNVADLKPLTLHLEPEKERNDEAMADEKQMSVELNWDDSEDELPLAKLVKMKLPILENRDSKSLPDTTGNVTTKLNDEPQNEIREGEKPEIIVDQSKSDISQFNNINVMEMRPDPPKKVIKMKRSRSRNGIRRKTRMRKTETQLLETHFPVLQLPNDEADEILSQAVESVPQLKRTRNNNKLSTEPSTDSPIVSNHSENSEAVKEAVISSISVYDFDEYDDVDTEKDPLIKTKENAKHSQGTNKQISKELAETASTPMKEIQNESFIQTPDSNDSNIIKKLGKLKVKGQRAKAKSRRSRSSRNGTAVIPHIFCEICNRSFLRTDSLTKHRRTLTHIAKLSELEALEAEANKKKEEISKDVLKSNEKMDEITQEVTENNKTNEEIHTNVAETKLMEEPELIIENVQKSQEEICEETNLSKELSSVVIENVETSNAQPETNSVEESRTYSNHDAYNFELVNIISDLKNIHVELTRYKSLGERKSFDSDSTVYNAMPPFASINPASNLANKTASDEFLKNQLSLLENIIEENKAQFEYLEEDSIESIQDSMQSNKFDRCLSDMSIVSETTKHIPEFNPESDEKTFVKPQEHEAFDEMSEDFQKKSTMEEQDKLRQRKTLNRDEELFLECCSLLKSSSEMSNNFRGVAEETNANTGEVLSVEVLQTGSEVPNQEDFLSDSCPNSPLQNSSENSTGSWNAKLHSDRNEDSGSPIEGKPIEREDNAVECEENGFLYNDRLCSEDSNSNSADFRKNIDAKFGGLIAEAMKNKSPSEKRRNKMKIQTSIKDYAIQLESKSDSSDTFDLTNDRKMLTKGAMKVFDSIKVSIPTDELDMQQVLLCSPTSKRLELEDSVKLKGKHIQFGNKLGLKVTKMRPKRPKTKLPENYIEREKHFDVYDFEETQDNTDLFRTSKLDESEGQSMNSFSTETESCASMALKPEVQGDNVTKKKCVIMGRIFRNAFKHKTDGAKEASPQLDDALESYIIGGPVEEIATPPTEKSPKVHDRPKMTEKEMDLLFDKLLQSDSTGKVKEASVENVPEPKTTSKMIKSNRRRSKKQDDLSDDEFNLTQSLKKRKSRKCHKKKDDGINLEQELKECMGVAGRKSQRKCTSGKQNVFIEYWSSDDSEFEAVLKLSMQETPTNECNSTDKDSNEANENDDVKLNTPIDVSSSSEVNIESKLIGAKSRRRQNGFSRPKSTCKSKSSKNGNSNVIKSETVAVNRRKRAAVETLYYWSSSSEDDTENLIEIKSVRDEMDDEEDRPQHGWIVGDSPKKLVTLLAHAKGKKSCNF